MALIKLVLVFVLAVTIYGLPVRDDGKPTPVVLWHGMGKICGKEKSKMERTYICLVLRRQLLQPFEYGIHQKTYPTTNSKCLRVID